MFISGDSLKPWLQVYFPEGSLEFEIITMKENCELEPSKRSRSTNFEESRKNLLKHACMRIDTQRKHQQLLKESTKNNEDVGKEILSELKAVCQQQEIDKVKLFTEEVDKITSLIIGLSSRLAKANAASAKNNHSDEKLQVKLHRNLGTISSELSLIKHFYSVWRLSDGKNWKNNWRRRGNCVNLYFDAEIWCSASLANISIPEVLILSVSSSKKKLD